MNGIFYSIYESYKQLFVKLMNNRMENCIFVGA